MIFRVTTSLRLLRQYGYVVTRQTGSHIRLKSTLRGTDHHITIPAHHDVEAGNAQRHHFRGGNVSENRSRATSSGAVRRIGRTSSEPLQSKSHRVVRRGPIGRRQRLPVQTQVHAKLGAVMHQVVQEHLPVGQESRSIKNRLTLKAEFPVLRPGLIGRVLQSGANLGCALVEDPYQLARRTQRARADECFWKSQTLG